MMNLEKKDEKIYPAMGNFGKIEIESYTRRNIVKGHEVKNIEIKEIKVKISWLCGLSRDIKELELQKSII